MEVRGQVALERHNKIVFAGPPTRHNRISYHRHLRRRIVKNPTRLHEINVVGASKLLSLPLILAASKDET